MDFELSEEQVAIRDTIRELVQDRVAPRAAEIDEKAEYPKDIERLFAENGILSIPFPRNTAVSRAPASPSAWASRRSPKPARPRR